MILSVWKRVGQAPSEVHSPADTGIEGEYRHQKCCISAQVPERQELKHLLLLVGSMGIVEISACPCPQAGEVVRTMQSVCDAVLQRQQLEGAVATGKAARLKGGVQLSLGS